ncbi:MAG: glycosyltransferase family 2 protein [Beijerinckiaceae bacterium]
MTASPITPYAVSPGLDPASVRIAVVIPTYKRPEHIVRTVNSVTAQVTERAHAVVVVENDAKGGEGAAAASGLVQSGAARGIVIVEPRQGNCNAYNAGFAAALAMFPNLTHVAIIDDDEIATPHWLETLCQAAAQGADIVGGPQLPVFDDKEGAARFANHPVFRPAHANSGSAGLITSTGNCLMSVDVLKAIGAPYLDERFNFLGGGDTDFFTRCRQKGFTFHWASEAAVTETVPARRTERSWITARSLRNGLLSALIQRKHSPGFLGRVKVILKSLALLLASPFRTIMLWRETGSLYAGSYHMMIAAGRLLAEFGYKIEQYREPEKN